jgi:hypothetical protein
VAVATPRVSLDTSADHRVRRPGITLVALLEAVLVATALWTLDARPLRVTAADPIVRRLPAVIREPGSYRLDRDLTFDRRDGAALSIAADDVTLDLQGHEIRYVSGAPERFVVGIEVEGQSRVQIANGRIVGFPTGVRIRDVDRSDGSTSDTGGHVVRRLDVRDCLQFGIRVHGRDCRIEENVVCGTGPFRRGEFVYGIEAVGADNQVRRNDVWDTTAAGTGEAVGLSFTDDGKRAIATDNVLVNRGRPSFRSIAVWVGKRSNVRVDRNLVRGFTWGVTYSSTTRGRYAGNTLHDCEIPICLCGVSRELASPIALARWVDEGQNVESQVDAVARLAEREWRLEN